MIEPILADYGLTEDDVNNYLRQKKSFDDEYKKHIAFNKRISFYIIWGISTILLILLVLMDDIDAVGSILPFLGVIVITFFFSIILILAMRSPFKFLDKKEEIKRKFINADVEKRYLKYKAAVNEYKNYKERCCRSFWENLSGWDFEKEVASLYRKLGYETTLTPATADGGVDVILRKDGKRIAVQCKHHKKPVGPNDVRALQGVVVSREFDYGIFISLNGYTPTVKQEVFYTSNNVKVELLELKDLVEMSKNFNENNSHVFTPAVETKIKTKHDYFSIKDYDIVYHIKFGTGQVTLLKKDTISCKFKDGDHTFSFPYIVESGILCRVKNLLLLIKPVEEKVKKLNISLDIVKHDDNYESFIVLKCFANNKSANFSNEKDYKIAILYMKDEKGKELLVICDETGGKLYRYSHSTLYTKIINGVNGEA